MASSLSAQTFPYLRRPPLPLHRFPIHLHHRLRRHEYHIFRYDGPDEPEDKGGPPVVEIKDSDDCFTVKRAVPGYGKETVKVAVDGEKKTVNIELRDHDGCKTVVPLPERRG